MVVVNKTTNKVGVRLDGNVYYGSNPDRNGYNSESYNEELHSPLVIETLDAETYSERMDETLNMALGDMNKEELVKIIMENPFNNLLKHLTDDIPVCVVNRKAELPKEIKKAVETIKQKKLVPDDKARKYTLTEEQFNKSLEDMFRGETREVPVSDGSTVNVRIPSWAEQHPENYTISSDSPVKAAPNAGYRINQSSHYGTGLAKHEEMDDILVPAVQRQAEIKPQAFTDDELKKMKQLWKLGSSSNNEY